MSEPTSATLYCYNIPMDTIRDSEQIQKICQKQGITYLGLFGSYARGENNKNSDVDLLAKFERNISLFDLARAQNQFSDLFKLPVDLVVETALKPKIRPYVEKDLITIYEKR